MVQIDWWLNLQMKLSVAYFHLVALTEAVTGTLDQSIFLLGLIKI